MRPFDSSPLADKSRAMRKNVRAGQYDQSRGAVNRRAESRLLCSDLIQLRWMDRQRVRHKETVVLEGFSTSGASMLVGTAIVEGTAVTVCGGAEVLRAVVRHCDPVPNGYLIGVLFWGQPRNYVPEHLLDPSLLS